MIQLKTYCIVWMAMAIPLLAKAQPQVQHLNPALELLCKRLDTVLEKEHIPGLMLSIVKKDRILFAGGLGVAELTQRKKVDQHTQFHFASITKFFVAMGIQQLVSSGRLNLHDRIHDIAPEVPFSNPWEATHPILLVHLLEHTAGFQDIQINKMINTTGRQLVGIEAVKSVKNSLTARWKPGSMTSYSNPGYDILGYILEKISGIPWDQYIQQQLFKPLNMDNSLFDRTGQPHQNFATGYVYHKGNYIAMPLYIPSSNGAANSLVSNAHDMAKFMHYLLNGGNSNLLPDEEQLKDMETVHSTLASQAGLKAGYALGNDLFPNNKKVSFRGHNGKGEGFVSWIFFNRDAGLAYSIAANSVTNLWPVSQLIEEFLTRDLAHPSLSTTPIDSATVTPMLGYYKFMNPKNERWEFYKRIFGGIKLHSIANEKLIIKQERGQVDTLIHEGEGIFRMQGDILPYFILARDPSGTPFFQGYGNGFYRKTAYIPLLLQKIPIYLGFTAYLLSALFSTIGAILLFFRKIKLADLLIPVLPVVGLLCFLMAYRTIGTADEMHKELFTNCNPTSFMIFCGMLLFPTSIITSCFVLYRRWSSIHRRWLRSFFVVNTVFLCYIAALLTLHGWIGVPIWMM